MLWHIYLSRYCNLHCSYCGSDPKFETMSSFPEYSIEDLLNYIKKIDKEPIINFYGGEPLLRIDLMTKIMDKGIETFNRIFFVLQTNGWLLNKIPVKYLNMLHSILISIDGGPEITNKNRGKEVYNHIIHQVKWVKKNGYQGEIIARMTITRGSNLFKDVIHLLNPLNELGFSHIHWQLDALWHSDKVDLVKWLNDDYNPQVLKLLKWWIQNLQKGNFYNIIPFQGILTTLLLNEEIQIIRCGAGATSYTINNNGDIIFCPICPEEPEAIVGSIYSENRPNKIDLSNRCLICDVKPICGGRCLYSNFFKIGNENDQIAVCESVKYLINNIKLFLPIIKDTLERYGKTEEYYYPKINNGCEIIP